MSGKTKTQLTDFEKSLLNKIIPTRTLSDSRGAQIALRNFIGEEKENIMSQNPMDESTFRSLQTHTVKTIFQYLIDHDFMGEREGGVTFLTEKGKHLRKQGSLEQYEIWRNEERSKNKVIISTIETRGYLDQDEVDRTKRQIFMQKLKRFIVYPLLVLSLLFIALIALHHFQLDKDIPFIRNLFAK